MNWILQSWKNERAAWLRFFFAIAGLVTAFFAALYSTVFREEGNLWAMAALASFALLLAGVVGLTTVPYLFRRVALSRVRQAFHYDVTREGLIYLGVVLLILVAALNTGNNLLFIVVSALLGGIVVSGIVSATMLRSLELDVSLPAQVFAQSATLAKLTLKNLRRWAPAFSVRVSPLERQSEKRERGWHWERSEFTFPPKRPQEKQWIRLPDRVLRRNRARNVNARIFDGEIYFPFLPPRQSANQSFPLQFPRRGLYRQEGFATSTRFPFSFLIRTRPLPLEHELLVYPSVQPTDDMFTVLPMITGEFETFVRGRGYNLYRIREYEPQDSARHVDWKATAKTGALKVREFTREDERKLRIVFDNPTPRMVSGNAYEKAISLAASLAWYFSARDTELSFAGPGYSGSDDLYEFLRYLALLEASENASLLEQLQVTDDYNVILTSRRRGSIPTALWTCSYFVFIEPDGIAARN